MGNVKRIYVEKKEPFAVKAKELHEDVTSFLGITGITKIRIFIRYDVENLSEKTFLAACNTVFSEPPVDLLFLENIDIPEKARVFSVEFLPGQFDQRADSAVQCVKFLKEDEEPIIKTAVTYLLEGNINNEFQRSVIYYLCRERRRPVQGITSIKVRGHGLLSTGAGPSVLCL